MAPLHSPVGTIASVVGAVMREARMICPNGDGTGPCQGCIDYSWVTVMKQMQRAYPGQPPRWGVDTQV